MINKDTKLFFSVSSKPGNFGALLYNAAFQELGINAIYKPLRLEGNAPISFSYLLDSLMNLDTFSGLSVSMPFKKLAIHCCDCVDMEAQKIGNINTIVRRDDISVEGYNTDIHGFERAAAFMLEHSKTAAVFGKGAVANSIASILKKKNIGFYMTRDPLNLVNEVDLLINASPVGMDGVEDTVFKESFVKNSKFVFDVVVKRDTNLINLARKNKIFYCPGGFMSLEQLYKQFEIYTGQPAPKDLLLKLAVENNYV